MSLPQPQAGIRQKDRVLCSHGHRQSRFSRGAFITIYSPTMDMVLGNYNSNHDLLPSD